MKVLLFLLSLLLSLSNISAKERMSLLLKNNKGCFIGRENDLCLGVKNNSETWSYQFKSDTIQNLTSSDIYRITQKYPALLGMDLGDRKFQKLYQILLQSYPWNNKYQLSYGKSMVVF